MDSTFMGSIFILAGILGDLTHQVFKAREPKLRDSLLLLSFVPVIAVFNPRTSWSDLLKFSIIYYSSCSFSLVAYRLSPLHPLAAFPGPTLARVSKLWLVWISSKGHKQLVFKSLHDSHGPIVRVGPNELSISDVDAVPKVLGSLPKGKLYDARRNPNTPGNLIALKGDAHALRRRIWNRGMSTEALMAYADLLSKRALQLVDRLAHMDGPVDLATWLSYFSFDFMGDMAFGGGFEMMQDGGDKDGIWTIMNESAYALDLIAYIPWCAHALQHLPFITTPLKRLRKFGAAVAMNRIQSGAKIKDLWYHLTDEAGLEKTKPSVPSVMADGSLAIIAGSDTVASALSSFFFFLLTQPQHMDRVRQELDSVFPRGANALEIRSHNQLVYMDACINEALRLYPPVPTNGPRLVPKGGKVIAERFIPGGTEVYVSPYCLHRNPLYFPEPDEFKPARWLEENPTQAAAFIPFSFGPANCVGRNLARQEMLMLGSILLQQFDFQIARREDFENDAWGQSLHDHMVVTRGQLHVFITRRSV